MAYSVFENDETIRGWKMGSSVAYCKPCFREVMEVSKEAVAGNDSNDSSKDRAPEKNDLLLQALLQCIYIVSDVEQDTDQCYVSFMLL